MKPFASLVMAAFAGLAASSAAAEPIVVRAGGVAYSVDPATLQIDATSDGAAKVPVMPPLHAPEAAAISQDGAGWRWTDAEGRAFTLSTEVGALRLQVTGASGSKLAWALPPAERGTWLIPDGEGMAFAADDPFWRAAYAKEKCRGGTSALSFPAWSWLTETRAVTYALGDGFLSRLCLRDENGVQAGISHEFGEGAETLDLLFAVRPPEPLAPALFYRKVLKGRGQFRTLADKSVPKLSRLYGAPQAYVWGDGRDLAFLDELKAQGIERINLSYDAPAAAPVRAAWLAKADALGYLAGPYELFGNGQPAKTSDSSTSIWSDDLYPAGCIRDAAGKVAPGFGENGCEISSEALARRPKDPTAPAARYAGHIADGATQVFVDTDAFGEFQADFSPDHPMSPARDRANRLARLEMAIERFHLVTGSENVTAFATSVAHYSHGTAQAHASAVWPLLKDPRFGGWWPGQRPPLFFQPFTPTPHEARALFEPADRLPLFEAVFHDSVIAADRWEFGLMKVPSQARSRFARALLYGTPTMWNLDRRELKRVGPWLKAAHDDFRIAHGWEAPVALTGFRWLTPDRLVQEAAWADGRRLVANFGSQPRQGLGPDCVRVAYPPKPAADLCPPADPPAINSSEKPRAQRQ